MPIVTQCTAPGCKTLTMGPLCMQHDVHVERVFVRGRPFARTARDLRLPTVAEALAPSLRTASERAVAVPGPR